MWEERSTSLSQEAEGSKGQMGPETLLVVSQMGEAGSLGLGSVVLYGL